MMQKISGAFKFNNILKSFTGLTNKNKNSNSYQQNQQINMNISNKKSEEEKEEDNYPDEIDLISRK